ncbi:transglutaminase-like cysteine peptidase [Caulobacter sp.]|uniref:transglutaminase-like cysteine peptidase n=1 Tax=Caulobacter sp. TaxID=78 RepID=UPI003BADAF5C
MSPSLVRVLKAAVLVAALNGLAACATVESSSAMLVIGPAAPAPAGFIAFCARTPQECGETKRATVDERVVEVARGDAAPSGLSSASGTVSASGGASAGWAVSNERRADWSALFAAARFQQAPVEGSTTAALVRATSDTDAQIQLDRETMALLTKVNKSINRAIQFDDDRTAWGASDYWTLPLEQGKRYGDCEDYVLEKRRSLIAKGLSPKALSIALVLTPAGEGHAVLLVATDRGEYVLDNLSAWVTPWSATGYRWLERQAPGGDPMAWVWISAPAAS